MTHQCKLLKHDNRLKLEACCQYGVDVDISERDRILEHREQIAQILDPEVRDQPWFSCLSWFSAILYGAANLYLPQPTLAYSGLPRGCCVFSR